MSLKISKELSDFTRLLNTPPPQNEVKINKHAGNSKYLPISYVQMKLDELFFSLWETNNFSWQVVANEIVGKIELRVFHPIANVWITKTGSASVMIQQHTTKWENGQKIKLSPLPSDVDAKIKNTLVKDFPHLSAACLTNATKSLGKAFGRDLNRTDVDMYNSQFGIIAKIKDKPKLSEEAIKSLEERVKTEGMPLLIRTCELFTMPEETKLSLEKIAINGAA